MGRKPKRRPSFFKVIIKDDFIHHLRLPHGFVEKYGDILPENAKLRTDSGETYKVKLEQIEEEEEEYCCFTQGWNKFALDIGLQIGEFLVFWYNIGKSIFDVSIYGITGCERKIGARINSLIEISDLGENVELDKELITYNSPAEVIYKQSKAGIDGADKFDRHIEEANPHFKIVLKEHRRSRVSVRKEFAIAAGLMGEKAVVLKYESEQRHWPVLLEHNPNMKQFRLDIGAGWNEFWRKNGLAMGKSYLFEYIRDTNVIQVKQA